jgi:hypothetical protein
MKRVGKYGCPGPRDKIHLRLDHDGHDDIGGHLDQHDAGSTVRQNPSWLGGRLRPLVPSVIETVVMVSVIWVISTVNPAME